MGETARRQAYRETLKILMTMVPTVHWCGPPMMSDLYLVNQVLPLRWHSHPLLLYLVNQILPLRWHSHPLLPCSRAAPEHHSQTIPKLRGKDLLDLVMQHHRTKPRMPLSFSDRCNDGDEQTATITSCCRWCHSHFKQV